MKKFLLFFAAILFGLTTNAQTYVSVDQPEDIEAGASYVFLNAYGWGPGSFISTGLYSPFHYQEMDESMQRGVLINEYSGAVNAEGAPVEFMLEDAGDGTFYMKNTATGLYVRGRQNICEETETPMSVWTITAKEVTVKDVTFTAYDITTIYNGGTRYFDYAPWGKYIDGNPTFTAASAPQANSPIRLFKKVNLVPVVPEIDGYEALSTVEQFTAGTYVLFNRFGWGPCDFSSYRFTSCHNEAMDTGDNNVHNSIWIYDGEVNGDDLPTEFAFEPASEGKFYVKDLKTGKYVNATSSMSESDTPSTEWFATLTDAEHRYFQLSYEVNGAQRNLGYNGNDSKWWPYWAGITGEGQPMRLYRKGGAGGQIPVVPTATFKGEVVPNLTSVSSISELEGIQLTFVDADFVSVDENLGDGLYVQNKEGSEFYAIWHPLLGGTYEISGNVVTLRNFLMDDPDYFDEVPVGTENIYFEDYGVFSVNNADVNWDGYINTFSVAYTGAPVVQTFELTFKNNDVVCANGAKVEAAESGVASDFYVLNANVWATNGTNSGVKLYKDGVALNFSLVYAQASGIGFFGGSSQMTEPGTYTLEVPAGAYKDAEGRESVAYYGSWVVIQKDEPVVPVVKDKYAIKLNGTDFYFTTTEVKDNSFTTYSLSATPEYFYIERSGNGYTIKSADTDKWVGYDVISSWDFSDHEKVWTITNIEGAPTLIYKNGTRGFGVDNRFEGAGVYTDKSGQWWIIEKYTEPEETGWNGNVTFSEAASVEDLLTVSVKFEDASEVKASNFDILGAIFDQSGDVYGIAIANGVFDSFGSVTFDKDVATVTFQKIADLSAAAQKSAKAAVKALAPAVAGKAAVVFTGKSFIVDGELVTETLCHEYEFAGGLTSINSAVTEGASNLFDLQGRRVKAAQKGIFIQNGQKVVR